MTTFNDIVQMFGGVPALAGVPFSKNAKYYFVDPVNGDSGNSGTSIEDPLDSVTTAEDKCVANQHDTIFYMAASSTDAWTASLTWDKSYTHLIGICAPTMIAQRARIHNETTSGQTPLLDISATGCIFKNFYIFQGVDEAVANINVQVSGGRNYFENVHFAGGGHASQAINGGASLKLNGAEENLFVNCTVGVDTIAAATGMMGMVVDGAGPRNVFRDCHFTMKASNAGAAFVEMVDGSAFDRYMIFKDCVFINFGTTMTEVFVVPAWDGTNRKVLLIDSYFTGATDWESNDRGCVVHSMGTRTTGGNAGVLLASTAA